MSKFNLVELTPRLRNGLPKSPNLRLRANRLAIGAAAFAELGNPESLTVSIDAENMVIELRPEGAFSISRDTHAVHSKDFEKLQEGLYAPIEPGVYQWVKAKDMLGG